VSRLSTHNGSLHVVAFEPFENHDVLVVIRYPMVMHDLNVYRALCSFSRVFVSTRQRPATFRFGPPHAVWFRCLAAALTCMLSQLKRNRDKLRPYMLEAGILPDETRKDKLAVSHPHLQALATLWGLPNKDSDFFRKYVNERALCQFLAEYTAVVDSESTSPVRPLLAVFPSAVQICSQVRKRFGGQIRSPTKDKKKDVLGSPPPQATGIHKTVMRPYKSGDLFASRGPYPAPST
jgi:hypothetical protein